MGYAGEVTEKIRAPADLAAWRAGLGDRVPAVVTGTYDILQPGNLAVLLRAAAVADQVAVVLEGDDLVHSHIARGRQRRAVDVRAEFVARLRYVNAVTAVHDPAEAADLFASLSPFTLVTAARGEGLEPLTPVAQGFAGGLEPVTVLPGCDTEAVENAIRGNATPLHLPAAYINMAPGSASGGDRPFPARGRRVTVNGCFDVLHLGHLRFLNSAAGMGDELVLLVNDDDSIRRYKGEQRPVFPWQFRCQALRAVEGVTAVAVFAGDDPLNLLALWKPDIHAKGGSYEPDRVRTERKLLESWGGRLKYCRLTRGFNTTTYIRRVLKTL